MQAAIVLFRGLQLLGMLSFLGTVGFRTLMLPAASEIPAPLRRRLAWLAWIGAAVALVAGCAWLMVETASMAGAASLSETVQALPLVAGDTQFGEALVARLGLLLVAAILVRWRHTMVVGLVLAILAAAMQGLLAHAGAAEGDRSLLISEALHLPAAGLWLGALLPLWLSVRVLASSDAALVCERFTPIGIACVLVIGATGVLQAIGLVGSLPGLLGTPYGHIILLKVGLFAGALTLALLNRLWLTDRLVAHGHASGLRVSIAVEATFGCLIILAAGWLASSVPAIHEQPVWPLPWRFSLETVNEDADFRREVIVSLILIGVAAVLFLNAVVFGGRFRRSISWSLRSLSVVLLVVVAAWRGPSLSLLTVAAYPTSFQTSPTGFSTDSIVRGQHLYPANCASCHGLDGRGDGPAAAGLSDRPADLTAAHVLAHPDGELIWWLEHGMPDSEGRPAMPGFAGGLPERDLWSLIDYVRAHNAGASLVRGKMPPAPMQAPNFPLGCHGLPAATLRDLRGHALLILAGVTAGTLPPMPREGNVSTVTIALRSVDGTQAAQCSGESATAWDAYAVLAGTAPADLTGAMFLVDPNGWLRAVHWPDAPGGWHTDTELLALVRSICAHPISGASGGEHEHHH
ncbi:MAG TPA: CopD family protein [Rhodopila sp.]|nr:CopD family protein [Rhodopila sp.]